VGIQLPEVERHVGWPEYVTLARAAERAGFDSVWLGDHLLYREDDRPERGPPEVWTLLAGLAAVTRRVRLGPLVACAGFHPPAVLAKMAAGVDEISGGRLVLGLGSGWNEAEFRAFGIPFDHRVSRFEEAFPIIRGLLAGERVTLAGRWWQADDAVLRPPPRRRPTLMVGSNGPRTLDITLPFVDAWNTWYDGYGNTPAGFSTLNDRITEAARRAGRRPEEVDRSACAFVVLDRTSRERRIEPDVPPLEGGPARIAASLRDLADAGADEAILVVSPITLASIEQLAAVLLLLDR
jgi:probable F420-dependent oxidoreductase